MNRTVPARITPEIFQEFAWFDLFRRKKRWRAPLFFAAAMTAFSVVCFLAADRIRGAVLLGCVLLGVGLLLPLRWLRDFRLSIRSEVRRLELDRAPVAYVLRLTDGGLEVSNEKEKAAYAWDQLCLACRLGRCIALYVSPEKAFLLPTETEKLGERIWGEICEHLPEEKRLS